MTDTDANLSPALQSSPVLQGERVAFTGTLASMTHKQAMILVEQYGGEATQHVGHQTSILVIGEEGWPLEPDGQPSIKLEVARQMHENGEPIQIVSESEWLKFLGIEPPERRTHQLHTPAMLCQLLGISVHEIRRWERAGLIKPVKKVYRLPYFHFDEVANARRLSDLAAKGVRADQIAASLRRLHHLLPSVDRPLEQLEVLARGSKGLAYRDQTGLIETSGQRLLDFDPPLAEPATDDDEPATIPMRPTADTTSNRHDWTAEDWFHEGCRLIETNELVDAIEALRIAIMNENSNPTYHFHLADALYRQQKPDAAIERYHIAVELDHNFLEAWTQLGCVLSETGNHTEAKSAFQIALDVHPDYADAHYYLASTLEKLEEFDEAAIHWHRYLEFDQRGPWAETAREHLLGTID